ncbi:hypothetical protein CKAN_01955200 [Cinnamomum micranthum f. kanehirae]|uniref:DUF639 domain-containing protein n=1 Tax=Cinnamomum micranthum f. kanehirae TaxID=337451 RepID=A0A443PI61_9MAGN|nr:hypothetical protein CKAN_01955200 [Cinnamomum micranthum f. kanehirae]
MESGLSIFETFMRQNSFKSLFRKKSVEANDSNRIPQLSPIANSVVTRCSRILQVSTEDLQHGFEAEMSQKLKEPSNYARNLLEYCAYKALNVETKRPDHLADKEFHKLTFDMMLAWEAPGFESESPSKETAPCSSSELDDEDGGSLFYSDSTNMAVQVDDKKTVGPEAFARIAPACPLVADIITVHNLFDALTSSSGGQLHFLIYDKYLGSLNKYASLLLAAEMVIKSAKSSSVQASSSNLALAKGEIILDVDGTVPTQPVLQHVGITAWPGRLTLTNRALYFEAFGVGSYDKPVIYDLEMDLRQVLKRELTGPLGARLFDKAIMYKSTSIAEPVYLEFPEFKGNSRRDYWLAISHEILYAHRFIRKFNLEGIQQAEALSKASLGVFRYHAVREAFHIIPSHFNTLLAFALAENLPRGDMILETLATRLELLTTETQSPVAIGTSSDSMKLQSLLSPFSLLTLTRLGFPLLKEADVTREAEFQVRDVCVGEINPLETAVKQSKFDSSKAVAAQATVDQVKVEGIDTNVAVMKELLFPVIELLRRIHFLASWGDSFKSSIFLLVTCYAIYRPTDYASIFMVIGAAVFALHALLKHLIMLVLWKHFTMGDALRKLSSDRLISDWKEWLNQIPAAPVSQLYEEKESRKVICGGG